MTVEGFEPSRRIGKKAFDGMAAGDARVWITDCPLAALQFEQHAGKKPLHPMSLLARAYRGEGFGPGEGGGER
jgi:Fe-S oxidoreductase